MEIIVREMDELTLDLVDQCDSTFVTDAKLVLSAENDCISYTVQSMPPREKKYPPEPRAHNEYLNNPEKVVFFAFVDGELAGQIRVLKWWNAYAYIDDLAVQPRFRGHGVGQTLLGRAVEWARTKGFPGVMLETQNINVNACRLYARFGFTLGGFDRYLYRGENPDTDEVALYWYLRF